MFENYFFFFFYEKIGKSTLGTHGILALSVKEPEAILEIFKGL